MLKRFCKVSSCNGIIDLYEARNSKCQFVFWAVIVIGMMGASVYFTYATIKGYITTPSVTNVAMVKKKHLYMPEVCICYNGGMNISAMLHANFSRQLIEAFLSKITINPPLYIQDELSKYTSSENLTMKQLYQRFSYKCKQMVEYFGVQRNVDGITTESSCDKAVPVWADNGVCYIFKKNGRQNRPFNGGMEITLKGVHLDDQNFFSHRERLKMKLTNDYSISLEQSFGQQLSGRSFTVPMNSFVSVTLNPKRYVRLPKSTKCDDRKEIYTSNTCFTNCYLDEYVTTCKCQTNAYSNFERYPEEDLCDEYTEWNCNIDRHAIEECQKQCLPKCDEWIYETTMSVSTQFDVEVNENSSTYVTIQYNTMQYTKIEEVESFTMDMAVANVGGQSGLWLGASFITIIQSIYYLVIALARKITNGKQNKPAAET